MKAILSLLIIGAGLSAAISYNSENLGDRIGTNIAKMRADQAQRAFAHTANQRDSSTLTVSEHITYLRGITSMHCQPGQRLLDSAATTYPPETVSVEINRQLTLMTRKACS
jgi:hypothetical protein